MQETWRWFGDKDPITLAHIIQAGATGIVTALHDIPTGEVWPLASILKHKQKIESTGLKWSVVESLPVHADIKLNRPNSDRLIAHYCESLKNLGEAGIKTVCYNFMPVVDWTRTNLDHRVKSGAKALRFDMLDFVAYDVFFLQRTGAANDYSKALIEKAKIHFDTLSPMALEKIEENVIAGLPGGEGAYTRAQIRQAIEAFDGVSEDEYRANLYSFLKKITPAAQAAGIKMCIHPDDPPFSLFGLPRIVSTASDFKKLFSEVPSKINGLTFCAGSLGARADNQLPAMIQAFGDRIYFAHLRNVTRQADGSFYESEHLSGDNDMLAILKALLSEEVRRKQQGDGDEIPMRPDHGHLLLDEEKHNTHNPGYSYLGRLKALAELRGVLYALEGASLCP